MSENKLSESKISEKKIETEKDYEKAKSSVFMKSSPIESSKIISGYDFNEGINYSKIFSSYSSMGFQASNLSKAIEIINNMIKYRLIDDPIEEEEDEDYKDIEIRKKINILFCLYNIDK